MRLAWFARRVPGGVRVAVLMATVAVAGAARPEPQSAGPAQLTVEQIAARMQARNRMRASALHSYTSRRQMEMSYKGVLPDKQVSETVEMTFTAPATKRFEVLSASGSPFLRESVFQREIESEKEATAQGDVTVTPATYEMRLVGREHLPQGECYVLEVSPRVKNKFGFEGKIWVQSPDFAVVRVEAKPVENPSFWVRGGEFQTNYEKVSGFWFPQKMTSSSHVRLGGDATLTIQYGPYRIVSAEPLATVAAE